MSVAGSQSESNAESNKISMNGTDQSIDALRAINQVRLIDEKDEGTPIESLPNGTYGFTYSPQEQSPIFRAKMFQIFEVHKTLEGEAQIIGFVTEDDLKALGKSGNEFVSISLYPEPFQNAIKVIGLPKSHILEHRGPTRENGNALKLKVEPISNKIQ